ncbi:caspase family protein [Variovorax guangxiensis]|uniref:caspase family protein n=1 Tax=Variovorax guangxiensis TaxID=1775474 RepID=UPI0028565149|nr:caspase family protein [Variovorax guangxiensis]MDR6858857.1 putative caspase-like protein [Variovorax guangxiensis]
MTARRNAHSLGSVTPLASGLCWMLLLALALALQLVAPHARAQDRPPEKRIALVVGNSQYPKVPLDNPVNDARLIAGNLRKLGFDVNLQLNVGVLQFRRALREFARMVQQDDAIAVLYYAGHGVQIDGRNYLLPVDINLRDQEEVKDESVDIEELFLSKIDKVGSYPRIVILDACRDNPFAAKTRNVRSAGGLAEMGARGTLIAFASAPGAPAEDGPAGRNSIYTRNLADEIMVPGLEVEQMFKNVRVRVLSETRQRQLPWVNTSLTSNFSFNPAARRPAAENPAAAPAPSGAPAGALAPAPVPASAAAPAPTPAGRDARPKDIDSLLAQARRESDTQVATAPPSATPPATVQPPVAPPAAVQSAPRPSPQTAPQATPLPLPLPQTPLAALTPSQPAPTSSPAQPSSALRKFLDRNELQQLFVGKTHTLKETAAGSLIRFELRDSGRVFFNSQSITSVSVNGSGRWELKDDGALCAKFNPAPPSRLSDARNPDDGCWYFYREGEKLMRSSSLEPQARPQAEVVRIQ